MADKQQDTIQQRLTEYACELTYGDLSAEAIHAAKVRVIDTLGVLVGGFFGASCQVSRNLAAQMSDSGESTIIGTRRKTTPDMAAFVNAITACHADMTDSYHWPGSAHGHPSNTLTPVLAVAEYAQSSGREFITSVVLAYEIYTRFSDIFHNKAFDTANFSCIATAVAASKLLRLSPSQLAHSISMAAVPNIILKQARIGELSMFYTAPAGQAGRAGVFAALLASAGMEGPHLPFEGKAGWCDHVARERFTLDTLGGNGTRFKILDTQIKTVAAYGGAIASILAAMKVAPLNNIDNVKQVTVETDAYSRESVGTGERRWNPDSREAAYNSIPYVVAVALIDGAVTLRSYNDAHIYDPKLRSLLPKIAVIENKEHTAAYNRHPQEHRARVTVVMNDGERRIGESGGDQDDLAVPKSDPQIVQKFRGMTEDTLGAKRVDAILDRLWHLEEMESVVELPAAFVLL